MPCAQQVRPLLAPLPPSSREPVFETLFKELEPHGRFDPLRGLGDPLLVSLDGTTYCASTTMHCPHGLPRQLTHGQTLSDPTALPPVSVCPGRPDVSAWPPEDILPPAGEAKQDGAQQAGKRGRRTQAQAVAPHQRTSLGDALSRQQPLCALAQHQGWDGLLT